MQDSWQRDLGRLAHAKQLAQAVALDMADWWQPTKVGYLLRVPKARILDAVREGVSPAAARGAPKGEWLIFPKELHSSAWHTCARLQPV